MGAAGIAALLTVGLPASAAAQATPQATPPAEPQLDWIGTLSVDRGAALAVGDTPHGSRLIVPATGGTFTGPTLTGTVVLGGGDWLLGRLARPTVPWGAHAIGRCSTGPPATDAPTNARTRVE